MRHIIKGSKEYLGLQVLRRGGEDFQVDSAEYFVRNRRREDAEVLESGNAQIEENRAFFLLDTTQDEYTPRRNYHAYFRVHIDGMPHVLKGVVSFVIIE